jgi:tetratricopeptide (TPR) repeat protein
MIIDKYFRDTSNPALRQKTVVCLEKILKVEPFNVETYELLEKFLTVSFQYEQLARVLGAHANICIQKRDYDKALELARHCVDLEPYNKEFRSRLHDVESLRAGTGSAVSLQQAAAGSGSPEAEEEEIASSYDSSSATQEISIVSDDDLDHFIVDIELLEKFGQHKNAIQRLERALKQYPHEIKLRQKLKTIYLDRQMTKKAAQECLEIAKTLQLQEQKEEATKYIREAQRLNPLLTSSRKTVAAPASPEKASPDIPSGALRGDLSEIGLLDIIQLLDNAQKSGWLQLKSEGNPGTIFFNSGKMVDASYLGKKGEEAIYALVGINGGYFEYQPSSELFGVVIHESNTNLLLEGLRRLDEANRDQIEAENEEESEPTPLPPPQTGAANPLKANLAPEIAPGQRRSLLNEANPLENI